MEENKKKGYFLLCEDFPAGKATKVKFNKFVRVIEVNCRQYENTKKKVGSSGQKVADLREIAKEV